jgi:hypothetical protein
MKSDPFQPRGLANNVAVAGSGFSLRCLCIHGPQRCFGDKLSFAMMGFRWLCSPFFVAALRNSCNLVLQHTGLTPDKGAAGTIAIAVSVALGRECRERADFLVDVEHVLEFCRESVRPSLYP